MGHFARGAALRNGGDEVFIQIIQGICHDADALRRQIETWREEIAPTAEGWLGGTDQATTFLDGGADDAGFVQVIQGRMTDPGRYTAFANRPMDRLRDARPEVIGGTMALDADGYFTQTVAFTSESAARRGESQEMPEDVRKAYEEEMSLMKDVAHLDLRHPWFSSKA